MIRLSLRIAIAVYILFVELGFVRISPTFICTKHIDSVVSVPGYALYPCDRQRRRGGGFTVYVRVNLRSVVWFKPADDRNYELLWVHVGDAGPD